MDLTIFVRCNMVTIIRRWERRSPASLLNREEDIAMFKAEDFQNYGKEQFETAVNSATTVQSGLQAIATAYGDYTKKSFEETKSFVEKLSGVKSLDKVLEAQTEFAKSAYETFVADSQKIAGLYSDLAKQAYKPFEGLVAKFTPASAH